jgi:transketolase, bacterial and yeast
VNDNVVIANIKSLGIDMINNAKSGHPGIVLGAAPILYTLYKNHININTSDPFWVNRDRFVMSAGHGSALLYSTLFMCGYALTIDDLKNFRRLNSKTPGHPEFGITPGVDCSTGPLGQGIANAVGMAIGEKIMKERYRINATKSLVDYKVYCLVGDGDLMEGVAYEAASLAGTLKLNNLIVLYDSNDISLDGPISKSFTENVRSRFEAMGWSTIFVKDGNDIKEIDKAIAKAKKASTPTLIEVKTKIGQGSLFEGTKETHGAPLDPNDIIQLKVKLNFPNEPFYVNADECSKFRANIANRVNFGYLDWTRNYQDYVLRVCNGDKTLAGYLFNNDFNYDVFDIKWEFPSGMKQSLRDTNTIFVKTLSNNIKTFIGGSADLGSSTKTYLSDMTDINASSFTGGNIWFGVREHAMGAILNGMALVHLKPYGSTFLSFADYQKPAMRMSALMKLPVTYIYTHDSISIGPDGPTHQPIEQLAMMRSIPGMKVYRPADAKELLGCWQYILNSNLNPSALVLSRNEVELMGETDPTKTLTGGYILHPEATPLKAVLVATGTEVHTAKNIAHELSRLGESGIRVVSMPCVENFLEREEKYKEAILPPGIKKIVIEAGSSFGWHRISPDSIIGIESFGKSGTKDEVLEDMDFSYNRILDRVKELLNI